jgi:hypothetical protein
MVIYAYHVRLWLLSIKQSLPMLRSMLIMVYEDTNKLNLSNTT